MLEYFTYKKFKKHQADKLAAAKNPEEVLSPQDEQYLEHIVEDDDVPKIIPLEDRTRDTPHDRAAPWPTTMRASNTTAGKASEKQTWTGDMIDRAKSVKLPNIPTMPALPSLNPLPAFMQGKKKTKEEEEEAHKSATTKSKGKEKAHGKHDKHEKDEDAELSAEEKEMHEALDRLNLAAQDGKAFSLSSDTKTLLTKFTQILKDLVNGVPTAYDDLVKLFETSSSQIEKLFENTPGFLKKLIKTLPLGPATEKGSQAEGFDVAAKTAMLVPTLKELITKPGSVVATLKTVMNALKLRFPGLVMGSNVLYSMGLFVLLFVFWYCYKRGREVRLEQEAADAEASVSAIAGAPDAPTNEPGTSQPPMLEAGTEPIPMAMKEGHEKEEVPIHLTTAL